MTSSDALKLLRDDIDSVLDVAHAKVKSDVDDGGDMKDYNSQRNHIDRRRQMVKSTLADRSIPAPTKIKILRNILDKCIDEIEEAEEMISVEDRETIELAKELYNETAPLEA